MAYRYPDFATGRVLELTEGSIELQDILSSAKERSQLVIVDFSVSWCGPCRMLAPVLDALASDSFGQIVVVKVDCECTAENRNLAATSSISAYPTIKFYINMVEVETMRGANPAGLRASVMRHLKTILASPSAVEPDLAAGLAAALGRVKAGAASPDEFMIAAKTLAAIVSNIVSHPEDPKYRTIKLSNASYWSKLGSKPGGRECMEVLGFKERTEAMEAVLVMDRVPEDLGTVVDFLNMAIAAAEGSGSGAGGGSGVTAPAPAPAAPSAAPQAEVASVAQGMAQGLNLSSAEGQGRATASAAAGQPPQPPPPGIPAATRMPNRLRAAAPDLSRRVWVCGAWVVPLDKGAGVLVAVPLGAPQRWLHFTPRTMAKALARCMQQTLRG